MSKKFLLFGIFLMVLILSSCSSPSELSCSDCNIIVINVELLRTDFIGLLNEDSNFTPNIDSFFSDSIIFEDVSAPAGATYESITAVFRGQESLERKYHSYEFRQPEPDAPLTIAEVLLSSGWDTFYVDEGGHSGKDVFLDDGFNYYASDFNHRFLNTSRSLFLDILKLNKLENNFLKSYRGKPNPIYVQYHINQLHFPFWFDADEISFLEKNMSYAEFPVFDDLVMMNYFYPRYNVKLFPEVLTDGAGEYMLYDFSSEDYPPLINKVYLDAVLVENKHWYGKKLTKLDSDLGLVFDYLESSGYVNNSIIFLYANHGQALGLNGIFQHGRLTQPTVHVPLFIHHPSIKESTRIPTPISLVDLSASLFSFLNIDHSTSGYSLVPLIEDGIYERDAIFGRNPSSKYIRKGDWKLIDYGAYTTLANISNDSFELVDLSLQYPEIARSLREELIQKDLELNNK